MSLWEVHDYVRLRTGGDDEFLEEFARRNNVRGKRVLDVGSGPGAGAAALAERYAAHVTAIDASPSMAAAARERVPASVEVVDGRAEDLPFADSAFDAVVAQFVVHLLDRSRAFPEFRRVLTADGVLFVKTADPDSLEDYWARPLFPSFLDVERARFPTKEILRADLLAAGFDHVEIGGADVERTIDRAQAIEQLRSGAYSTMRLLPPDELAEGIRRASSILPDPVHYRLARLIVYARP